MKLFVTFFLSVFLSVLMANGQGWGADASAVQTASGGGVTAKVTYVNPNADAEPRFQVVLDTHSVGLDAYDLVKITVLRDDTGKSYLPTGAEYKGSGHHQEITLVFPKLFPETKGIELIIKDVANVKERTFRWNLQ